jgi:CDP-glycerol glycerophosphotransferase
VVIYNQSLSDFSSEMCLYALGAVCINLWHGVPWKKIGLDAVSERQRVQHAYTKYLLRLQRPDLYLATSDSFGVLLRHAYCTTQKGILKAGYPRNLIFYREERMRQAREKILGMLADQAGAPLDPDTKIITYMPTFRDRTQETFSFDSVAPDTRLRTILETHNAVIVQKAHAVNDLRRKDRDESTGQRLFRLNKVIPMELLAATDLLITDYSGCFFDFLLTDRPIIHYLYDYEYYVHQDRGVYYAKDDVICGDAVDTLDDLLEAMDENLKNPHRHSELRRQRRSEYMTYESENSCQIICEALQSRLHKKKAR